MHIVDKFGIDFVDTVADFLIDESIFADVNNVETEFIIDFDNFAFDCETGFFTSVRPGLNDSGGFQTESTFELLDFGILFVDGGVEIGNTLVTLFDSVVELSYAVFGTAEFAFG